MRESVSVGGGSGPVTLAPPAGANLAGELFNAFLTGYVADYNWPTQLGLALPAADTRDGAALRHGIAVMANHLASAIVTHITTNATVATTTTGNATIALGLGGLQRDPVSPFEDCLGPTAEKTLPVAGTGTGTIT